MLVDRCAHSPGHGTRREDFSGDEGEETKLGRGHDEYMVLLNERGSRSDHLLSDDEINAELARLPAGCRVVIAVDACHSGSVCDMQYSYSPQTRQASASRAGTTDVSLSLSLSHAALMLPNTNHHLAKRGQVVVGERERGQVGGRLSPFWLNF